MSCTELSSRHVTGKRDHDCEWCGQKIPKGESHLYRSYKMDGEFTTGRMHKECEQAMYKTPREELEDGWAWGSMERGK